MGDLPTFVPGLELAEGLYREAIRPILDGEFSRVPHSAGLLGKGSDVLGFDSARSRDHDWGPRALVFLSAADYETTADALRTALRRNLPPTYRGYSVHFGPPDPADAGSRTAQPGRAGAVDSLLEVTTLEAFVGVRLGRTRALRRSLLDWLSFPEQSLLEIVAGEVFHDGLGTLRPARESFAWFPRDVWLHRLAAQWQRIAQVEPFVGRCAEAGDDLGSRLIAGRLVRDAVRLAFLMERRYAPYDKWLGTAFARLTCAPRLSPHLERALAADAYPGREAALCAATQELARMHNALAITPPLDHAVRRFFDRPYHVIDGGRFDAALRAEIEDPAVRALPSLLGAPDQLIDLSSASGSPILTGALRRLYGES